MKYRLFFLYAFSCISHSILSLVDSNPRDYRFLCLIGKGTYGLVYLARHRITRKLVAIKRVPIVNEKCHKRAYNELDNHLIASRPESLPYILSLYQSFRDEPSSSSPLISEEKSNEKNVNDTQAIDTINYARLNKNHLYEERRSVRFITDPIQKAKKLNERMLKYRGPFLYLVLEYIKRGTLADLISEWNSSSDDSDKNHGLPMNLVKKLSIQLYESIHYLHFHNIVHRDIKPDNIFIKKKDDDDLDLDDHDYPNEREEESNLQLRLADFGLSFRLDFFNQRLNAFSGTAGYLPPEAINGNGYGICVDWFSFGAIIYRMITGTKAFPGRTAKERNEKILESNYPDLSLVSDPLAKDLISRLLEKDEAKRLGCNTRDETIIIRHAFFSTTSPTIVSTVPIITKESLSSMLLGEENIAKAQIKQQQDHFKDEL